MSPVDGLVIVDKPGGWTSHDVVARMRRLAGTRKVGHAGTLDPMATGMLICGIGKATRLLGLIADKDKAYDATIRLGITTNTDDAEGEVVQAIGVHDLLGDRTEIDEQIVAGVKAAMLALTGEIEQRPSSVSAIKVDGKRAYKLVREGQHVELPKRPVTVSSFELHNASLQHEADLQVLDLEVTVGCSTGTYIRALARDLGTALGAGGHLTSLRRTRVGPFNLTQARTMDQLAGEFQVIALADVTRMLFPYVAVNADQARHFCHGGRLPKLLETDGTVGIYTEAGQLLGLAKPQPTYLAPAVVWADQLDEE